RRDGFDRGPDLILLALRGHSALEIQLAIALFGIALELALCCLNRMCVRISETHNVTPLFRRYLVVKHEGHHHVDLVFHDASIVAADTLFLYPRRLNTPQRVCGPSKTLLYRVL